MRYGFRKWLIEFLVMSIYKLTLELGIIRGYIETYEYKFEAGEGYVIDPSKWITGFLAFLLCSILLSSGRIGIHKIYNILLRFIFCICIIPMIAVYSFYGSVQYTDLIYPLTFYIVLVLVLKHYSYKETGSFSVNILIPGKISIDKAVLFFCAVFSFSMWAMAGFPIALNMDSAYERRMALRLENISPLLNYPYMIIGGSVLPYLFAKFVTKREHVQAILCLLFGILLFFINGMKTWLLLYIVAIGIMVLWNNKRMQDPWRQCIIIDSLFLMISLVCIFIYELFGKFGLLAEFSRVTLIPNQIGFKSVNFFRSNELLYLRESILRVFFKTPYPGGSDFYINHGSDITATTGRANNGLWGDAFRNFGGLGIVIYAALIGKVFHLIEKNTRGLAYSFRIFVLFLLLWTSINTSFFTWLLTDGVIILLIMLKMDKRKDRLLICTDGTECGELYQQLILKG